MQNPLATAVELAKEAGFIQMESFGGRHTVEFKGLIDIVTEADKRSEELIVHRINKDFPGHDVFAEEGSGGRRESRYRWIIDPLDGTVNYNSGYPFFGPSIALEYRGKVILGVVYLPVLDELYIAEEGSGAERNGAKISVSGEGVLRNSLLATGFAYNVQEGGRLQNFDNFRRLLEKGRAVRQGGMAAGDLCFVASGRFEGYWELHLKPWDVAAGSLIVKEAGGTVTNADGSDIDIYGDSIVASNGWIHAAMLKELADQ